MPLYDYCCTDCQHEFSDMVPMERHREPAPCPRCQGVAERQIGAPRLSLMPAGSRKAHQTNERSAHEPRLSQAHRCGAGCAHHRGSKALKAPGPGKRPWMLGH